MRPFLGFWQKQDSEIINKVQNWLPRKCFVPTIRAFPCESLYRFVSGWSFLVVRARISSRVIWPPRWIISEMKVQLLHNVCRLGVGPPNLAIQKDPVYTSGNINFQKTEHLNFIWKCSSRFTLLSKCQESKPSTNSIVGDEKILCLLAVQGQIWIVYKRLRLTAKLFDSQVGCQLRQIHSWHYQEVSWAFALR